MNALIQGKNILIQFKLNKNLNIVHIRNSANMMCSVNYAGLAIKKPTPQKSNSKKHLLINLSKSGFAKFNLV